MTDLSDAQGYIATAAAHCRAARSLKDGATALQHRGECIRQLERALAAVRSAEVQAPYQPPAPGEIPARMREIWGL